jgi:hypothetical protein
MSWLKIEKNVELEFRIVSTHFVRLTSQQLGVPKPFQQYRVAISLGFSLLICLQKRAFDTASKQKTLSLS